MNNKHNKQPKTNKPQRKYFDFNKTPHYTTTIDMTGCGCKCCKEDQLKTNQQNAPTRSESKKMSSEEFGCVV